ncbi:MAG: Holliday junction resolvase Hjc [Candidatus Woesearchaeota archaeon]
MNRKAKGSNAERELVEMFWQHGWAAIRVAGSGSARFPNPDVLAGNKVRRIAVECKSIHDLKKYLSKDDVEQVVSFAERFGAEPWIGIRFDKLEWFFISPEELKRLESGNFVISLQLARQRGLSFKELIS